MSFKRQAKKFMSALNIEIITVSYIAKIKNHKACDESLYLF